MAVGRTQFHWTDEKRMELETRIPDDHRELMVYLFYPAERNEKSVRTQYMPDVEIMRGEWKDDQIAKLREVQTHSQQDGSVARERHPYSVVIFEPGGGQKALSYTTLLEDLASHGYVVAAIDPPYNAAAVGFPNGTVLRRLPPAERGWETPTSRDDMPRIYEQMVIHWARDMSFVLDRLSELNTEDTRFARMIDVQRVGAFGHSRSGQAAGKVRLLDPRFVAGLNIDGNIRGRAFPPDANGAGGKQPFLWLEKQLPWPTEKDLQDMGLSHAQFDDMWANGDRLLQSIGSMSTRVIIARSGIDHLDFGDTAILDTAPGPDARAGKLRTLEIARLVTRYFFDAHLKGTKGQNLPALANKYPEIKVEHFR
jgi:predicted dienelactone hydrolase